MTLHLRLGPARLAWVLALALLVGFSGLARAIPDANGNKIDDRIESVNTSGLAAAYEDGDLTKRMLIGVFARVPIQYAIYIGYDHHPTDTDAAALAGLGLTVIHPYQFIDYIRAQATFPQIQSIVALGGVRRVEAIPMYYALNHYGSRVVRVRDSRGISRSQNYVLFPSVRQELGYDGTGVVIGILDTGVNDAPDPVTAYPGHESVRGKFLGGGNFFAGDPNLNTPMNQSENPNDHGGEASSYHATHVSGTAMGTGGPGGFFAGIAPGARLVDCKVLADAGAGFGAADGVDWCIGHVNAVWPGVNPNQYRGVQVINMSLGCLSCSSDGTSADEQMVNAAVDAGITVCIATGNGSTQNSISSPAGADQCIAVGASSHNSTLIRTDDRVTDFSNEGPRASDGDADHLDEMKPSVVAPGAGIVSADGDPTTDGTFYKVLNGTSMACPHVAGCVAVLKQANPSLTPLQIRAILQNTAEHNIPSVKNGGADRPNDPFGVDPNYDPGCGWGLVDMYAAVKEALNATSGVQVTQILAPQVDLANSRITVGWITQREFTFLGFDVYRAPDVSGAPGAFTKLNASLIVPAGHANIQGVGNRTPYTYVDADPGLVVGNTYWYQVRWVDLGNGSHAEPPVPVQFGTVLPLITAYYSITHNAVGNDLLITLGGSAARDPAHPDFFATGPPEALQDSSTVILPTPSNTGTSTFGTVQHFWSVNFTDSDIPFGYRFPSPIHPWFLDVAEGGFINRSGRVNSFSLFVRDNPGGSSGTTYVTDSPTPQETVEGQHTRLWIPEVNPNPLAVGSHLSTSGETGGVRLVMDVAIPGGGVTAMVYRSLSAEFETRQALPERPVPVAGTHFEYVDHAVEPGVTYFYWVDLAWGAGTAVSGPVAGTAEGAGASRTIASPAAPNPAIGHTSFGYSLGTDAARGGAAVDVSLTIHDLQGRLVRTLGDARQMPGQYRIVWDTTDDRGVPVTDGVYYVILRAGSVTRTSRVAVAR